MSTREGIRKEEAVVAVLDVCTFMKGTAGLAPAQVFELLDRFAETVGTHVSNAGGSLVKCIGDALLVYFPREHAAEGVAALRQAKIIADTMWGSVNPACRVMLRIHAGPIACGLLGPVGAKHFDVIGNTVNELFCMKSREEIMISPAMNSLLVSQ